MGALESAAKKASAKTDASLKKVNAEIQRFVDSVDIGVETVLRKKAGEIVRDAMRGTPVDTGQARAGWSVGLDRLGQKLEMPAVSPTTKKPVLPANVAKGRAAGRYEETEGRGSFSITVQNGVRHAVFLEAGHSKQAPRGFVRRALVHHRRKTREEMRRIKPKGVK